MTEVDQRDGPPAGSDIRERIRRFWDLDAETYDHSPSHSASDPVEAAAWRAALSRHLPPPPCSVLDVGAGTGAMTMLAAELGYAVTALDLSEAMLSRARAKAEARGWDVEFVVASNTEPPPGPFDAVIERHVLWTSPDPVLALRTWRAVASGGRLVLFEGIWQGHGVSGRGREVVAGAIRAALRIPKHHHSSYDPDLFASLPLAGQISPGPVIRAVAEAGWRRVRIERLRDVEWARRLAAPNEALAWLEGAPQFAIVADA
jgi:SAM-dependent methyltransferase